MELRRCARRRMGRRIRYLRRCSAERAGGSLLLRDLRTAMFFREALPIVARDVSDFFEFVDMSENYPFTGTETYSGFAKDSPGSEFRTGCSWFLTMTQQVITLPSNCFSESSGEYASRGAAGPGGVQRSKDTWAIGSAARTSMGGRCRSNGSLIRLSPVKSP